MRSKYLRASFTCPGARRRKTGIWWPTRSCVKTLVFGTTARQEMALAPFGICIFSGVEIFLPSSSNREVSGGPVSRSLCHAAIHEL